MANGKPANARPLTYSCSERAQKIESVWTARRCRSLLRPLESQLAALRRHIERHGRGMRGTGLDICANERLASQKSLNIRPTAFRSSSTIKHTYAGRRNQPKAIGVPATRASRSNNGSTKVATDSSAVLKLLAFSPLQPYYQGILGAVEALLLASTRTDNNDFRCSGLSSMCLRKVPDYISQLEEANRAEQDVSGSKAAFSTDSASSTVYSFVEDLAMQPNDLKQLVRWHAVRLLQDAIADDLLHGDICDWLVQSFAAERCPREADGLMAQWVLQRAYPRPDSTQSELPKEVSALVAYGDSPSRVAFLFRILTALLSDGRLPKEWLATEDFALLTALAISFLWLERGIQAFEEHLTACISLLVRRDGRGAAFCESEELFELRTQLDATPHTLASIMATAMPSSLASQTHSNLSVALERSKAGYGVRLVLKSSLANIEAQQGRADPVRAFEVNLVAFLTDEEYPWHDSIPQRDAVIAKWMAGCRGPGEKSRATRRHMYDSLVFAIAQFAKRRGSVNNGTRQPWLLKICEQVGNLQMPTIELSTLQRDAAFRLADFTSDLRDLQFAEDMTAKASALHGGRKTPMKTSATGVSFRWDAGISEWVTTSPQVATATRERRSSGRLANTKSIGSRTSKTCGFGRPTASGKKAELFASPTTTSARCKRSPDDCTSQPPEKKRKQSQGRRGRKALEASDQNLMHVATAGEL